jgi:3-methyl-2-oxobutanoate hydroxymethyltransferase
MNKITVKEILSLKGKRKITMLTAYDYPIASLVDKAGLDIILVGDSLANVVLGLDSTTKVGMAEMLHHSQAVTRAVKYALVVGDMPYESYQVNPEESVKNALRFISEAGCDAVKLEWFEKCPEVTKEILKAGIPVMGHIGLTPQTADKLGGFKVQGKDADAARQRIGKPGMFCHCPGVRPGQDRRPDHPKITHTYNRHRRRPGVRRAGIGDQ